MAIPQDKFMLAEDLRRLYKQDERHYIIQASIDMKALDLMQEGQSCDPYGFSVIKHYNNATNKMEEYVYYNLFEGFNEAKKEQQIEISELCRLAIKGEYSKVAVFDKLMKINNDYWLKQAKYEEENN